MEIWPSGGFLVNLKKKKRIIMKNPNHLTMADQSALNLLAKVTNKFCIFDPRFLKVE